MEREATNDRNVKDTQEVHLMLGFAIALQKHNNKRSRNSRKQNIFLFHLLHHHYEEQEASTTLDQFISYLQNLSV
jgi:hypothetical protein